MRIVLICNARSRLNHEVLARFVASRFELVGIVAVQDRMRDRLKRIRNEWRRSRLGLIDVVAMRLYYRLVLARRDRIGEHVDALLERFPLDTNGRDSIAWGQARLTDYLRWKHAARRSNAPATGRSGWAASLRAAALAAVATLKRF